MAHEGLWEQLVKLDGNGTACRAMCRFVSDRNRYIINLLNTEFVVDLPNRKIFSIQAQSQQKSADFLQQLCLLTYLINAQDVPLANKLVKGESLPGGQFFFRGIHSLPTEKLANAFGEQPEALYRLVERFEWKRCEFGDASIQIFILPRIPLTVVVWRADEEFEARASILFDQTAANHLPLDALWTAVNLAVDALVKITEAEGF
jgi:hypothetical protein